jgi:hypothetical protein
VEISLDISKSFSSSVAFNTSFAIIPALETLTISYSTPFPALTVQSKDKDLDMQQVITAMTTNILDIDDKQVDMDLDEDDYVETTDLMDVDEGENDLMDIDEDDDEDLYRPQSPYSPSRPLSHEDLVFLNSLNDTYFIKPKRKGLLQQAISNSQLLLVEEFNARDVSLERWEDYLWIHRYSTTDPL